MARALYWFRNDLRLQDNPVLNSALQNTQSIAFIYVHDPRLWQKSSAGIPRLGWHRRRFLKETLQSLADSIREKGFFLYEFWGIPEIIIPELISENRLDTLYFSSECAPEERSIEGSLFISAKTNGFRIEHGWSQFLLEPRLLQFPLSQIPDKFTDFRNKIESTELEKYVPRIGSVEDDIGHVEPILLGRSSGFDFSQFQKISVTAFGADTTSWTQPLACETQLLERVFKPNAPDEKQRILCGGAAAGKKRIDAYIFQTAAVRDYYSTRNGLLNSSDSTLFSAWLANGSLSAREIFWAVREFEGYHGANKSTYWVIFELLWREFFKLHLLRSGPAFFQPHGLFRVEGPETASSDEVKGRIADILFCETQSQFINANMRELIQTGFMSNRGRQNVASYMIYDLAIPWTLVASLFESLLIDYDVASNWGNCAYIAGVSFDPRGGRRFNIEKQEQTYDPQGTYVSAWSK
ncbi:DASH family cryptochrome [bacterium]|nr:DASH family cryptochrome [bacterium]